MKRTAWMLAGWMILTAGCGAMNQGGSWSTPRLAAQPQGDPVFDPATLHCLGAIGWCAVTTMPTPVSKSTSAKSATQDWQARPRHAARHSRPILR